MRLNLTRLCAIALAAAGLTLFSAPKDAEAVSLNLINTWEMGDHVTWSNQFNAGGDGEITALQGPAWAKGGIPTSGINIHFGIGLGKADQIVPFLGLGMARTSYSFDFAPEDDEEDLIENDTGAALQFGLEIGGKFFLIERAKGKAPPFLIVSFFKYFGSVQEDGEYEDIAEGALDPDSDDEDGIDYNLMDNQILSPLGFKLAFGAEYYFNDNFAIGGEFLGVKFTYARAVNPTYFDMIASATQLNLYTSLTMTYRFRFTVRASVQCACVECRCSLLNTAGFASASMTCM